MLSQEWTSVEHCLHQIHSEGRPLKRVTLIPLASVDENDRATKRTLIISDVGDIVQFDIWKGKAYLPENLTQRKWVIFALFAVCVLPEAKYYPSQLAGKSQ